MSDFSVGQAAFSGFGLIKRQPLLWLVLTVFGIAVSVGISALAVTMAGPQLTEMAEISKAARTGGAPPNPQATMALLPSILTYSLVALIVGLVAGVINAGAVNRAVVRPKASTFPFIGFGKDELRLFVVLITLCVIVGIPSLILLIIGQIVSAITAISVGGREAMQAMQQGGRPPQAILIGAFVVYGVVGLIAFLAAAKFALANAQTVAERGIRIFGSWTLTNGRYWKVVGALLLSLIALIPFVAIFGIILFVVARATGGDLRSLTQPDYSSMGAIFTPLMIVRYLLGGALSAMAIILGGAAAANIYRAVAEGADLSTAAAGDDDDEDWDDED